jgi:predicted Zn-dependent peptidase
MHRILIAVVLLLVGLGATAGVAQDIESIDFPKLNDINIPDVEKVTLDNGMRIYLLQDRSLPLFNVNCRINVGSYLEPADKVGLANICGDVMRTGGTEKWAGDEIDELLEGIGGTVEHGIRLTEGTAYVNVLSEYADLGMEVLSEVMRRPVFEEDKIELAKVQARTGISRRNDDIAQISLREWQKIMYGEDSPYARHSEYATINAITRDDLVAFHRQWYHPQNIQIAIRGDFDRKKVMALVRKYFGDWPAGSVDVPPPPPVDYDWRSQVYYIEKTDVEQSYVRCGHIGGLTTDPDYADRIVMNSVLGGGFGSRITENVRTKQGLAYAAFGNYISNYDYPGYFICVASTKPQSTVQAAREMIKQTRSMLTDPPTKTEMAQAKDGYLNSFVFNFDSPREVINRIMTYDYYGLPEDRLQQVKERIEAITPEDVMAAARNNLRPDEMVVLVVGDASRFDVPLEELGLGPVTQIDITIPSGAESEDLVVDEETRAMGREVLVKAAQAHGGLDAFKKVTGVSRKATLTVTTPQGEIPLAVEELVVYPDKSRSVVSFMGQQMYDIRDGQTGWKPSQMGGVEAKTEKDIMKEDRERGRDFIWVLQHADDPSFDAVFVGPAKSGGVDVHMVAILDDKSEEIARFAFGAENHQVVSISYWGETFMGDGMVTDHVNSMITASGLTLPKVVQKELNGQKFGKVDVTELTINPEVPENAFAKPE